MTATQEPTRIARNRPRAPRGAAPYLLLLPAAVMYALFTIYPIIRQFDISFFDSHIFPGVVNPFVGRANYRTALHDPVVRTATLNTVLYVVITVPAQMLLGLIAAAALTDRLVGIWKGVGWSFVMFLAALDGVPRELVEAARVDGAGELTLVSSGLFGVRSHRKLRLVIGCLFALVAIFPLLYMVSLSFQPAGDILAANPVLVPGHPTTANYAAAWGENSFAAYFANSLYVSAGTVAITLVLAALAAYAFARFAFRFRELIFCIFLASLAVPSVELIMPQYLMMSRLHLTNSPLGLVLIYVSANLPFSIFLLRGFFEAIPPELEESFRLDGAGTLRVLYQLILPLSVPALATVAIFVFNAAWDAGCRCSSARTPRRGGRCSPAR